MKVEQRIYTEAEQIVTLEESNEYYSQMILTIGEANGKGITPKLFLTNEEAIELSNMLKSMVDKRKTNSL
jgi:cobalamin biosynthesis protein CbiD